MEFHERLRVERKRVGLSQGELAARAGAALQTQSLYETGKTRPKPDYFAAIARTGIDIVYVITGERAGGAALTADEGAIVNHARRFGPADRQALIRLTALAAGEPLPEAAAVTLPSEDALTLMFQAMLSQLVPPVDDPDAARTLARRLPAALAQTRGRDLAQASAELPAADAPPPPPAKRRPARSPTPHT